MIKRHRFSIYIVLIFLAAAAFGTYVFVPKYFANEVYPLKYADLIRKHSTKYNVDPALVAGLLFQESRFNPNAVSYAGAQGIAQFMPGTARTVANEIGLKNYNIFDAETGIELSCAHLRDLLNKYGGDVDQTLASYNAGTGTVDRWLNLNIFQKVINSDSNSETVNYVRKIKRYRDVYRTMYADELGLTVPVIRTVKPEDTQAQIRGYIWTRIFSDLITFNK